MKPIWKPICNKPEETGPFKPCGPRRPHEGDEGPYHHSYPEFPG